ncbi:MAG: right-handed parallel beta-helix repeat-containing protein [Phycisphaerae bacterium]
MSAGTVHYVDVDASGPVHDGSSWCDAYTELYSALNVVSASDTIRIADGTYTPETNGLVDRRSATFWIPGNITIEGGYAGCGAVDPDLRDLTLHETTLSGNIGTEFDFDNCYHVVTAQSFPNGFATLDGVVIADGKASGAAPNNNGAGLYVLSAKIRLQSCTVRNNMAFGKGAGIYSEFVGLEAEDCVLQDNDALSGGGGVHLLASNSTFANCIFSDNSGANGGGVHSNGSLPSFVDCEFAGNDASGDGGAFYSNKGSSFENCMLSNNIAASSRGGAILIGGSSPNTFIGCSFMENQSVSDGGAIYIFDSGDLLFRDCLFNNNSGGNGGAIYNLRGIGTYLNCRFVSNSAASGGGLHTRGMQTLINCLFADNHVEGVGGGATYIGGGAGPTHINCTFANNSADLAGGVYVDSTASSFINSILWGNEDLGGSEELAQLNAPGGNPTVVASCIQGWSMPGIDGNINDDPLFVNPAGNFRLDVGSPSIDTGLVGALPQDMFDLDGDGNVIEPLPLDLDRNERVVNAEVDMGAYEFDARECGNGILEGAEECDDGNTVSSDGCDDNCQLEGPCCFPGGECLDHADQKLCVSVGGSYQGDGLLCADIACPALRGACCFPGGECVDDANEDLCVSVGGSYQGDGTTCVAGCAPCGDADDDNDIDLHDWARLQLCFTGTGNANKNPLCDVFDCDGDTDIDLDDYMTFLLFAGE